MIPDEDRRQDHSKQLSLAACELDTESVALDQRTHLIQPIDSTVRTVVEAETVSANRERNGFERGLLEVWESVWSHLGAEAHPNGGTVLEVLDHVGRDGEIVRTIRQELEVSPVEVYQVIAIVSASLPRRSWEVLDVDPFIPALSKESFSVQRIPRPSAGVDDPDRPTDRAKNGGGNPSYRVFNCALRQPGVDSGASVRGHRVLRYARSRS